LSWVLGVDGGNTKTLAAVADESGQTHGAGSGGTADIYNAATPDDAIAAVEAAVGEALERAGIASEELDAAVFSLAGADWPEDFALLETALRDRLGLAVAPLVVNDAIGALRGGSPDWTGIAVVSGTYNAVGARHPDGRVFHLGFWPDAAGGHELGVAALRAVYHAALDMGPPTVLSERAFALYGAEDAIGLLHEFTRRGGLGKHEKDRLAPVVLDAADEGDDVACAIVADKGRVLGRQARACGGQLDLPLEGTRVVLTGGVFGHPTDRLADATMAELPGAVMVRHPVPPIEGALLLALDQIHERRSAAWAG
jgi:N-acetylglucosamine kinase-like BadF-type ATPase